MPNLIEVVRNLREERVRTAKEVAKLDRAITVLSKLTRSNGLTIATAKTTKRRTLSAAARRKIAAAQRARWARWKEKQAKKAA
jgi:hypothetical protein